MIVVGVCTWCGELTVDSGSICCFIIMTGSGGGAREEGSCATDGLFNCTFLAVGSVFIGSVRRLER
jgi:hypothetical protein